MMHDVLLRIMFHVAGPYEPVRDRAVMEVDLGIVHMVPTYVLLHTYLLLIHMIDGQSDLLLI